MHRSMVQSAATPQPMHKTAGAAQTAAVAVVVLAVVVTLGAPGSFGADSLAMHLLNDIAATVSMAAQY